MTLVSPLYMLRHGETAWNTERRMQGARNSDLTERGRAQAVAMGRALKTELAREPGPTIFLRSPLGRTRETSLIVGPGVRASSVLSVRPIASAWARPRSVRAESLVPCMRRSVFHAVSP